MEEYVGMDLDKNAGDMISAIIEALQESDERVVADDLGVFIKVRAPGRMELRREAVEDKLGRVWSMDDLQVCMASYFGYIQDWDEDHVIIAWGA